MGKHFQRFKNLLIDHPLEEIEATLEQEGAKQALKKAVPLLGVGLVFVSLLVLGLALLWVVLGAFWKYIVPVLVVVVLLASYRENHKSTTGSATIKEPTMQQYVIVGNIVKVAAKRVAPVLGLSPIFEESDIKAAKDERIIQSGKYWLFKYRFLKKSDTADIDTDVIERVFQFEIQAVLDNDNPAGFDTVRFVYGGVDECILQVDHVSQGKAYVYLYCCFASNEYFEQREQAQKDEQHDETDTTDIEF